MYHMNQLQEDSLTSGQMILLFKLRMIWRDIATWTKVYLDYVFLDSDPELKQAAAEKLTDLPISYANIFRIYFGDQVAVQHTALMSNYTRLLIALIDATKSGDVDAINEYTKQIYQNVEERVNFLTTINPFWERNIMSNLLTNFTNIIINEINSLANKYYLSNIDLFSTLLSYSDRMGDYFADGLLRYLTYSSRQPNFPQ